MKTQMVKVACCLAMLALTGCVSLPSGPSVRVLPGVGKSFEAFLGDDNVCRQWAARSVGISPGEIANQNTASGAVLGTALGAAAGAAIGAAAGNAGAGAAIGAGSGLLLGTASGAEAGQMSGWEAQRRYDNTYIQCMYAKGNQVPGAGTYYQRSRRNVPPPPNLDSVPPDYVPERVTPYSSPR